MSLFKKFGLSDKILQALDDLSFDTPTPVQDQAIVALLKKRDVLAIAQTGTGKTAAFGLPLLAQLEQSHRRNAFHSHALILAPTRELAAQIQEALKNYAKYLPIQFALIVGGVAFGPQLKLLQEGVDIVVATPGRLLDHARDGHFFFEDVRYLVLDEADRMLDMGFIDDIQRILKACPPQRQTMLFSATFSKDIRQLADRILNAPVTIEIAPNRDVAGIKQTIYQINQENKRDFLRDLIVDHQWSQVLVFTQLKSQAAHLAREFKEDGFTVDCIHGDRTQAARTLALEKFKDGKIQILVATDVVARGIDIKELPYVVNYDLPNHPEDYVHRVGRTGRAGMTGYAVSLMQPQERYRLQAIEKLLSKTFSIEVIDEAPSQNATKKNNEILAEEYVSKRPSKKSKNRPTDPSSKSDQLLKAKPIKPRRSEKRQTPRPKTVAEFDYVLPDFDF